MGIRIDPPGRKMGSPLVMECTQSCPNNKSTDNCPSWAASGSANKISLKFIKFNCLSESLNELRGNTNFSKTKTLTDNLPLKVLVSLKKSTCATCIFNFLEGFPKVEIYMGSVFLR